MLNATIIYLKDNPSGTVDVTLEIIGEPTLSYKIAKVVAVNMSELDYTRFNVSNEFTQSSPSNQLQ
jgi:hypothetical protein